MIKFKNWMDEVITLEVQVANYLEGKQLGILLVDPEDDSTYSVVTRNIPEANGFLAPNQTLIPDNSEDDDLVQQLVKEGVLRPTDIRFPYNFYTMRVYEICFEKVDKVIETA